MSGAVYEIFGSLVRRGPLMAPREEPDLMMALLRSLDPAKADALQQARERGLDEATTHRVPQAKAGRTVEGSSPGSGVVAPCSPCEDSDRGWITCPNCRGDGQPTGDGSGWDGTTMHVPACELCDGGGAIPGCDTYADSCHGDPDIAECPCVTSTLRERGFARDECPHCLGTPYGCSRCCGRGWRAIRVGGIDGR